MERLKKHNATLRFLQKAPTPIKKRILEKASPELIRCICDCAHNVLQGNVPISEAHKRKLKKHKNSLRKLVDSKVSLKKKRKISQTGGFLSLLLSALAPVLGGIVGGLTK